MHAAHDAVLQGEAPSGRVRGLIVQSWLRSAAAGLDSDANIAPITIDSTQLGEYRSAHPLSNVFALLYDVLGRAAEECDSLMAVGDAKGQLLWVCGLPSTLSKAERINFVEGAAWDESRAGTNAPGTALRLDAAVQIYGAEHFARSVQPWSCVAAPIHDPVTQAILGVVDVTGGRNIDTPQTMGMVRAAARMAEAELGRLHAVGLARAHQLPDLTAPAARAALLVDGLGRPDCQVDDGARTMRLTRRHSEILAVLSEHPDGLTSDQLALEVYSDDVQTSTLRAEMTRLRALLGPDVLESRPYRLCVPVECDWSTVGAHLAAGRLRDALRGYRGPLLPQSDAPGVVQIRERLERQLRAAVIASGNLDLMIAWTRSRWGADDLEMWQRQAQALPAQSPLRPIAVAEVVRLHEEFGLPALSGRPGSSAR
jgi:hypothetical protein